jgi:hypothetical protein
MSDPLERIHRGGIKERLNRAQLSSGSPVGDPCPPPIALHLVKTARKRARLSAKWW